MLLHSSTGPGKFLQWLQSTTINIILLISIVVVVVVVVIIIIISIIAVSVCGSFTFLYNQDISKDPVADFQSDGSGIVPAATVLPEVPVSTELC